jgi:hypothetical protein
MFLLPNKDLPPFFECLIFQIDRKEIEAGDTKRAMNWLNNLLSTRDIAWANREKLLLSVSGYDFDSRELPEIPEVCNFLRTLHRMWPYWFFFANQYDYTLPVLVSCICKSERLSPTVTQFDRDSYLQWVDECTGGFNSIFDQWGLPEDENKRIWLGAIEILKLSNERAKQMGTRV